MKTTGKISLLIAALTACSALYGCDVEVTVPEDSEPAVTEEQIPEPVTSFRAQDDFYGYVNLDRLTELEIGYNQSSAGSFEQAQKTVDDRLDRIILDIAESSKSYPAGSNEQIVHDYYNLLYQNLSEKKAECPSSEKFFSDIFSKIDSVSDTDEFISLMAVLNREYCTKLFLNEEISIDINNSGRYGVYIKGNDRAGFCGYENLSKQKSTNQNLKLYIQGMLKAEGTEIKEAEKRAENVVKLVLGIARNTDYRIMNDPYSIPAKISSDEMNEIFSSFDFDKYFEESSGQKSPEYFYIYDRTQLETINSLFTEENLQALKDFARGQLVSEYGTFLPDTYKSFRSRYFSTSSANVQKVTLGYIKDNLAEICGELYSAAYRDEETVKKAGEMCETIRNSCSELVDGSTWLTPQGKENIHKKLANLHFLIAGSKPAERDASAGKMITGDLLETTVSLSRYFQDKYFENAGKECSKDTAGMPDHFVNACYDFNNTITIPLGILTEPFFSADSSDMQNLGSLGSVIAHELSHAFDSSCINFNADGNYSPDWMPESDIKSFNEKIKQAEEYYSNFTIMDVYHVDGKLTLSENFADIGGFQCVLNAASGDAEKKTVMESYAGIWCTLEDDRSALHLLRYDVHSPSVIRVNAVLSCFDDFYRIYNVKESDGMYIPSEKRITRW